MITQSHKATKPNNSLANAPEIQRPYLVVAGGPMDLQVMIGLGLMMINGLQC